MIYHNKYTYNVCHCQFYLDGWGYKSGEGLAMQSLSLYILVANEDEWRFCCDLRTSCVSNPHQPPAYNGTGSPKEEKLLFFVAIYVLLARVTHPQPLPMRGIVANCCVLL